MGNQRQRTPAPMKALLRLLTLAVTLALVPPGIRAQAEDSTLVIRGVTVVDPVEGIQVDMTDGKMDHIFDIPAYGSVKIPLSKLNERKRAKVQAIMKHPKTGKYINVYSWTWTMGENYRAIFIMKPDPRNPGKLIKERIVINKFRMIAPKRRDNDDDRDNDGERS